MATESSPQPPAQTDWGLVQTDGLLIFITIGLFWLALDHAADAASYQSRRRVVKSEAETRFE
jgi:hypothetical protein